MTRPPRRYTEAERTLFAQYRDARSAVRPDACTAGRDEAGCWVEEGPPALTRKGAHARCHKCLAVPRTLRRTDP